jgi:hypothetical protein
MAEDEAGFTFVDKRKVVGADEAGEVAVEEPSATISSPESDDSVLSPDGEQYEDEYADDPMAGEGPDIYMLLQYCTKLLAADAWQKMGLLADPRTGEAKADLPQAKVAIDAVGDLIGRLETAPDMAVPAAERRDLRNLLNDLRLNYVNQRSAAQQAS